MAGFPFGIFIGQYHGRPDYGADHRTGGAQVQHVSLEVRAFLTTGILGGYTTFSTFSLDSALLIQRGAYAQASDYVIGSVILSILALFAGFWMCAPSMPEQRQIDQDDDGIRLDRWFRRHYPALTHAPAGKTAAQGRSAAGRQARQSR